MTATQRWCHRDKGDGEFDVFQEDSPLDHFSPLGGAARNFLVAANEAPMRLAAWRRQVDLLELLKVAATERFRDPTVSGDMWAWNERWHRTTGRVIEWAHRAPGGGRRRLPAFEELNDVVHEAHHWKLDGAVDAAKRRLMRVRQDGRHFTLTMALVPDLEFLDMLLERETSPSVPEPPSPRAVNEWFSKRAFSGKFEELDTTTWDAVQKYARRLIRWQRSGLPEGMIDEDLQLTESLTLGRSVDLYAILLALRIIADSAVRFLNYPEASLMSFTREGALQLFMEADSGIRQAEASEFIEMMTYRPGQSAHASSTPLISYLDRLILPLALVTTAGVERTLLRSIAADPDRFGSLGQRLGRLADRIGRVLGEVPGVVVAPRVKVVRKDGTMAGDIDVLAVDAKRGRVFAIEVKWPVEALTLKEASKVDADVRRGATQLQSLRRIIVDGEASLLLAHTEAMSSRMEWSWFVATPGQLAETGIDDIYPTSLRHLRAMLPVKGLDDLEARLRQRPKLGEHFTIGQANFRRMGLSVHFDTIEAKITSWGSRDQ